jgi:hypothetical protein
MTRSRKNPILLGLLVLPILLVGGLFFVPVDLLNAGAPGLASGKLVVERLEDVAVASPWLQETVTGSSRLAATCTAAVRGGGRQHVKLTAGDGEGRVEVTLVLARGMFLGDRAAAILRRPGVPESERRRLSGRLQLSANGRRGEFDLRVEPEVERGAWRGGFVITP